MFFPVSNCSEDAAANCKKWGKCEERQTGNLAKLVPIAKVDNQSGPEVFYGNRVGASRSN